MDIFLIVLASFVASLLSFFSGFGLGTLLMPVFALFFPIEMAIAMTAIVHFLNNIMKFALIGKKADRSVYLRFGLTAIPAAFLGALLLNKLSELSSTIHVHVANIETDLEPIKIVVGTLMIGFSLFEIWPTLKNLKFEKNKLWLGCVISGFFGGLSGHQGAMRSAFLIKYGLSKETFIATGIVISLFIDVVRMATYSIHLVKVDFTDNIGILLIAVFSAFAGAIIGRFLLKKITLAYIQYLVAAFLFLIGAGLIMGFI
jgi:uncharacterized membrane protein YfcA